MNEFIDSESDLSPTSSSPLSSSSTATSSSTANSSSSPSTGHPYIKIIEQPAKCGVRFRYECEGRISGAIPGQYSTTTNPSYPTIKIMNYKGRAKVIVSCVTKSQPYKAHPHNLVGKRSCKDGVCCVIVSNEDMICSFNNLGILCAKRKDIKERLKLRELINVDPFGQGFGHKSQALKMIDLSVIRLCYQVFLEGPSAGDFRIAIDPVVSDPIYDKKAMSELSIAKLSHYSASCSGGQEVIMLCDRVMKDDIEIRFYEEKNDLVIWESRGQFKAGDIHKHFAIAFRTPKYFDESIQYPVTVNVQLKRPSDGGTSEALPFYMLPAGKHYVNNMNLTRKRQKISSNINQFYGFDLASESMISTNIMPLNEDKRHSKDEIVILTPRHQHQQQQYYHQEYILPQILSSGQSTINCSSINHQPIIDQHEEYQITEIQSNGDLNYQQNFIDFHENETQLNHGIIDSNSNNDLNSSFNCLVDEVIWSSNHEPTKDEMQSKGQMASNEDDQLDILDISSNTNTKIFNPFKQFSNV